MSGQHAIQQIERRSEELYIMKTFIGKGSRNKEVKLAENGLGVARSLSFRGWRETVRQMSSLVLTR